MSLYQRRPDLTATWKPGGVDRELRSSVGSYMSINAPTEPLARSHNREDHDQQPDQSTWQQPKPFATFASQRGGVSEKDHPAQSVEENTTEEATIESSSLSSSTPTTQPARLLSVQDRINIFENKQKENSSSSGGGGKPIVGKYAEFRRFSSDASVGSTVVAAQKSVLRRWSGASDMSIDVTGERNDPDNSLCMSFSGSSVSRTKSNTAASVAYEGKVEVDQTGEPEEVMKNSSFSSTQKIKAEDSDIVKKRNQKLHSGSYEYINKSGIKRDETQVTYENSKLSVPGKELLESQGSAHVATIPPLEQFQRPRQSKGNRALNDDLKMKADELEKLFAEHKQRVPGDQNGSAWRIEPAGTRAEQSVNSQYRKPGALKSTSKSPFIKNMLEPTGSCSCGNVVNFDGKAPAKMVKNHNYGDSIRLNFLDLNSGDNSRGKFYERYMQKRDAKLREEWSSKRSEKEAKIKAMQDNLEQSRAEMKAKFLGSLDKEDSVSDAQRHTEKLRYFDLSKKKEQYPVESLRNEVDEDISEFLRKKSYGQYILFCESSFEDCASRQSGKNLPNRSISTSIAHSLTVSKVSNSSGRRSDNPLAQSVPNFSDLRKENAMLSVVSKILNRSQVRNYAPSRSTN